MYNTTLPGSHAFANSRINGYSPTPQTVIRAIKRDDYSKVRRILTRYRHLVLESGFEVAIEIGNLRAIEIYLELIPSALEPGSTAIYSKLVGNRFSKQPSGLFDFLERSEVLSLAVIRGYISVLMRLYEIASDRRSLTEFLEMCYQGVPISHLAIKHGRMEIFDWLTSIGIPESLRDRHGRTIMHAAMEFPGLTFEMMFRLEVSPKIFHRPDYLGVLPLHLACSNQGLEIVKFLMPEACPQNLNVTTKHNRTPLYYAVRGSNAPVVQYLVDAGAAIGIVDQVGGNILHHGATFWSKNSSIPVCLAAGATREEINAFDFDGNTPLQLALKRIQGMEQYVQALIRGGANLNFLINGNTIFHVAIEKHWDVLAIIQACISNIGSVRTFERLHLPNLFGVTVLKAAASGGYRGYQLIKFLLGIREYSNSELNDILYECGWRNGPGIDLLLAAGGSIDVLHPMQRERAVLSGDQKRSLRFAIYFEPSLVERLLFWAE